MKELLLAVRTDEGDRDVAVGIDDRTTVGQLVDRFAKEFPARVGGDLTLERVSRGSSTFARDARLAHEDLRSGDTVRLTIDTGVRQRTRSGTVGRVRVSENGRPVRVLDVHRGEMVVGRSSSCDIPLADSLASRRHAKLVASDVIEVVDLGSTNGTTVNDVAIMTPRRLRSGDRVRIGDAVLTVDQAEADAAALDTTGNAIEFNRPPRLDRPLELAEFTLPPPPDRPRPQRLPMITAIAPVLMGAAIFAITRSVYSIMFIALSPMMMLGSWWESRRTGRHDFAERLAQYEQDRDTVVARLDERRDAEVEARFTSAPAVGELDEHVRQLSARLWERQPGDRDFLDLRVGLAARPAEIAVKVPESGARDLREELQRIPEKYRLLPPVPVTLPLEELGNLGVAGPSPYAGHVARALVAQSCALHSPSEVIICAMLGEAAVADWAWLKWLPQTRSSLSPLTGRHLAFGVDANLDLLAEISRVIAERRDDREDTAHQPRILVLITDDLPLERARLTGLLDQGPQVGVHVLWVSGTARRLPKGCKGVVEIAPSGSSATVSYVTRQERVDEVRLDLLDPTGAGQLARDIAPIVDVSSLQSRGADIPRLVSMVDLLGGPRLLEDGTEILHRWQESASSRSTRGLRVPIGAADGGVFSLDLGHDGPHGLVAGTTGAGKSELLQSLLIGLAVTHTPDRVTFLLVDYKGGSAFKDCVRLPHTVGLVTDLTPALVKRALTSLRAELHRRERLLHEAGAKDLEEMASKGHPHTPPSLLIVVDEFAALAREVPEFVDGVVDVAQRGRSLGLHLLLATQRPQGVITDNIRANTNLRIALRVATDAESQDVIDSPVAAQIDRSLNGRGVARLGPSDLIRFQTGYAGGHTEVGDDTPALEVSWFDAGGRRPWSKTQPHASPDGSETDLERLVVRVNEAFERSGLERPRRPWLDPLHARYDLLRLPRSGGGDEQLPIGVSDEPEQQWQRLAVFEPDRDGSLLVYGAGGAGKTVALRTLAASACLTDAGHPVRVYGIDATGRGLDLLLPLPPVGSIATVDDHDRVTRLLGDLAELLEERSNLLGSHRASTLPELRANAPHELGRLHRVLLLVDGFEGFQSTYEQVERGRWLDLLLRLAASGRQAGIHVALTGSRRTSFPTMLTSSIGRRLILRLANLDEYAMLGTPPGMVDGDEPPGRAIDGAAITQIALVGTRTDTMGQADALRELGQRLTTAGVPAAPEIRVLPDRIEPSGVIGAGTDGSLIIGLDDRLRPFALTSDENLLVTGPTRSGRTNAISAIAAAAVAGGKQPVVLAGRRSVPSVPGTVRQFVGDTEIHAAIEVLGTHVPPLLLIDDLDRLLDGTAAFPLEQLLQRDDVVTIAACEVNAARRYSGLVAQVRRARRTFLLSPDPDLDGDLAGAPLPRGLRGLPPGRGVLGDAGQLRIGQFVFLG